MPSASAEGTWTNNLVEESWLIEVFILDLSQGVGLWNVYQQEMKRCGDSAKGVESLSCSAPCQWYVSFLQMKMNVNKTMVAVVRSV